MISSTILLESGFTPADLIMLRFLLAFVLLTVCFPKHIWFFGWKNELLFALAGLCGVTLYFFCENTALEKTSSSSVSIIVSTAPFFTAMWSKLFHRKDKLSPLFFLGFSLAIIGIVLISFNTLLSAKMQLSGIFLAACAAAVWGLYSVVSNRLSKTKGSVVMITRRVFFYGLLFMLPVLPFTGFSLSRLSLLSSPKLLCNVLYLGACASGVCYLSWNWAIRELGAVRTSVYIYGVPVVTVLFSFLVLGEKITAFLFAGTLLTILGLVISLKKPKRQEIPAVLSEDPDSI